MTSPNAPSRSLVPTGHSPDTPELEPFLVADLPVTDEDREPWFIDGPNTAQWALERLRQVLAKLQQNLADAEGWHRRVDEALIAANKPYEWDRSYFENRLKLWWKQETDRLEAEAGDWLKVKVKSHRLPSGRVSAVEGRESWTLDQDVVLAWAKENRPELVKTVESVLPSDAKRLLRVVDGQVVDPATGEKVPGVVVERASRTYRVEVIDAALETGDGE